jgi:flagellar biogenesis protein FliO
MVFARNKKPNSDPEDEEIEWQINVRENFTLSTSEGTGMQMFGKVLLGLILVVLAIYLVALIINKAAGGDTNINITTPPQSSQNYSSQQPSRAYGSPAFSM